MISTIIVVATVLFAVVFTVAWLISPKVRRSIEQPKHQFQDSVHQLDRRYNPHNSTDEGGDTGAGNESR